MLAAATVVDVQCPGFEIGEDAMIPGQDDRGGPVSNDVRVVCDAGPAVGPGGGAVGIQEGVQAVGGDVLDLRQADRPAPPSPTAPAINSLPWWLRLPPLAGSSLERQEIRLSSTSSNPASGMRCGATMARRSLAASRHAVLQEPRPRCFWRCSAAIPLACVAIRQAARNHRVSASLEPCITVPAVTEICLRQSAHSWAWTLVASAHPRPAQGGPIGGASIRVWKTLLELQQGPGKVSHFRASQGDHGHIIFCHQPHPMSSHFVAQDAQG